MRRAWYLGGLVRVGLLAAAVSVVGVPLASAIDIACPTGAGTDWQDYLDITAAGNTCHIGNLRFSNFDYISGGTNIIAASAVGVSTLTTPGDEGFRFNPAINLVGGNLTSDVAFIFDVAGINGGAILGDLEIFFNGAFSGTGSTSFSETHSAGTCTPDCTVIQVTNPPANISKHVVFDTPVTSMHIVKDVIAATGANGQASISIVENRFSQVPEPRLLSILVGSLLAGFGFSKKFKRSVLS